MKRFLSVLITAALAAGCSTPAYVLHTRAPSKWYYLFWQPREKSEVSADKGLLLLSDRRPFIPIEFRLPNGGASVRYQMVIKNESRTPVALDVAEVKLVSAKESIRGIFESEDLKTLKAPIKPREILTSDVRFEIPASWVDEYAGTGKPLFLQVSANLRKELWLWKE